MFYWEPVDFFFQLWGNLEDSQTFIKDSLLYYFSVELTERYSVHLVKYNDELYCCSAEVSALIWEKDLLRSMLRQKKATFDKVTLSSEEQPDIFEELKE